MKMLRRKNPLSIQQLFQLSWWFLIFAAVASAIDWYFLDSEYRDYLRMLGIVSFAGYLIGLVAILQSRSAQSKEALEKESDEE